MDFFLQCYDHQSNLTIVLILEVAKLRDYVY